MVACNTVSAVALDVVQRLAGVPVVGVIVPGAAAAVQVTKKKRVGVIGTVGTIHSKAYINAIRQFDPSVQVFGRACPLFVPLAEEGWLEHRATELIAREYLFPLSVEKIDVLVLGCTHYPILSPVIQRVVHDNVTMIDSGEETAAVVGGMLEEAELRNPSRLKPHLQFFVSDVPYKFTEIGERFLGQKLGAVKTVGW